MKDKIKNFFKNRYGTDQLSIFLIGLSVFLNLLSIIFKIKIFVSLSYIPLFISLFRTLSTDKEKRSMENYKFFMLINPIYKKINTYKKIFKERKKYKHFKCPNCKSYIRIPKNKGRLNITCTKCGTNFEGRT